MPLPAILGAAAGRILSAVGQQLMRAVAEDLVKEVAAEAKGFDLTVSVKLDLTGLTKLKGQQRRAVYRAVQRCAKPIRASVISEAGKIKKYGFLMRSIGSKTRIYKGGIVTVVGPKMSFVRKRPGKAATRGENKGQRPNVRPFMYAWILEKGSKRTKKLPFLQPAWEREGPGYRERLVSEIAGELAKVSPSAAT